MGFGRGIHSYSSFSHEAKPANDQMADGTRDAPKSLCKLVKRKRGKRGVLVMDGVLSTTSFGG